MNILYATLSFLIGAAMNVQSGVNGQIRLMTDNPIFASFANFIVGTILLLLFLIIAIKLGTHPLPSLGTLATAKWWMWMGGPLGLIYVMAIVVMPLWIGYASFFSMLVAGQLISSVAIDHNGWLGNRTRKMNKTRVVGVLLLLIGAILVQNT